MEKIFYNRDYFKNINDIFLNDDTNINLIILQPQESLSIVFENFDLYNKLNNELRIKNCNLTIYIGSEFDKNFSKRYDKINLITWDSIDYFSKNEFHTLESLNVDEQITIYNKLKKYTSEKYFTSLTHIKNGRIWRTYIINEIYKNNLIDFGNYIFNLDHDVIFDYNFLFDYPFRDKEFTFFNIDYYSKDNIIYENNFDQNSCEYEYMICSLDVVIETIYDYFFVTEKTIRPIDAQKAFIVFSGQDYHKKLRDKYGFKLYDNIIDYSFDNEESTTKRFNMIINELIKLKNNYTPNQIKELTRENCIYNYNILKKLKETSLYTYNEFDIFKIRKIES